MKTYELNSKEESGFTLVELAIVMIIIGLLIGGILKGQQLIANAEISSTVTEIKGSDSAISTFREAYSALPGDMTNVVARIPNCAAACARNGDGNGSIGNDPGAAHGDIDNENGAAWAQLAAADMIGGVVSTNPVATVPGTLNSIPAASIGGNLQVGYLATGALTALAGPAAGGGHHILLDRSAAVVSAAGTAGLTPSQAARLDRKLDDGAPNTGSVRAMGGVGGAACADDATVTGVYNEALSGVLCGIYVRVQS